MNSFKNILFATTTLFAGVAFGQNANTDSSSGQLENSESVDKNGKLNSDSYKSGRSGLQKNSRRGSSGVNSWGKKAGDGSVNSEGMNGGTTNGGTNGTTTGGTTGGGTTGSGTNGSTTGGVSGGGSTTR